MGEGRSAGAASQPGSFVLLDRTLAAPTALAHRFNVAEARAQTLPAAPATLRLQPRRPEGELRCVLAVIRHGDRTPKQKMKMKVTQEPLLALLHKYMDSKGKQAKLKVRAGGWRRPVW